MQFTTSLLAVAFTGLVSASPAKLDTRGSGQVKYDTTYDNAGQSMNTVSCSDGVHGLASRWPTFGSLPGGWNPIASPDVGGWGSTACGTCYKITYQGNSVNAIAVDHGATYNLGLGAMNALTGGRAQEFGQVTADVQIVQCPF